MRGELKTISIVKHICYRDVADVKHIRYATQMLPLE